MNPASRALPLLLLSALGASAAPLEIPAIIATGERVPGRRVLSRHQDSARRTARKAAKGGAEAEQVSATLPFPSAHRARAARSFDGPGLIVDLFAGGGGASTGIEAALGRSVDLAVNHSPVAIAVHDANHRGTRHPTRDVIDVDPIEATRGKPV